MSQFSFLGGSFAEQSANADAQRSMNVYPEPIESGSGPTRMAMYGTPGLAAFGTLPTSPVRGLCVAGSAVNNSERLFVVAGSQLYEIASDGSIVGGASRGSVGDDATHSPVQMYPNGNQLLIVSAGAVYCDNGTGPVQPVYDSTLGTCYTDGSATVYRLTGASFEASHVGKTIMVAGTAYVIASVETDSQLNCTANIPAGYYEAFSIVAASGTCNPNGTTRVWWSTGSTFDASLVGQTITIAGTPYTVTAVYGPNNIIVNATVPAATDAPFTTAVSVRGVTGAFLDGYYIAQIPQSRQFNISALNDGTSWSSIDFGVKEAHPDYIAAILADHEELWLFGEQTTEVWQNTGNANFPLERISAAVIQTGIVSSWAAVSLNNGVAWVGRDARGRCSAWRAQGFQPVRVSTYALENTWSGYSVVNDCRTFVYNDGGHSFWAITFPTAGATFVYDDTTGLWHERGWWNGTTWIQHRANCHAHVWNKHIVGDYATGALYTMSTALYDDAGTPIHRFRAAPHINLERVWIFYSRFWLDLEAGTGASPVLTLDWSDDGGHTFGTQYTCTAGAVGAFLARVLWRRLGRSRDRVFRISMTAACKVAWIGAYLESGTGTN